MLLIQLIIIPPHLASPPLGERDLHAGVATRPSPWKAEGLGMRAYLAKQVLRMDVDEVQLFHY